MYIYIFIFLSVCLHSIKNILELRLYVQASTTIATGTISSLRKQLWSISNQVCWHCYVLQVPLARGGASTAGVFEIFVYLSILMSDNTHAQEQAKAQYESIRELMEAFNIAEKEENEQAVEEAREAIQYDPLEITVRNGWHQPGGDDFTSKEYCILLCTGGPAVRIIGELDQYNNPQTATLECQDWGTEWESWNGTTRAAEHTLLSYASHFYFGE